MKRHPRAQSYAWLRRTRWASALLASSLPLFGSGCMQFRPSACLRPAVVRAQAAEELLPPPAVSQLPPPSPTDAPQSTAIPISLDTVFRLAEQQNPQIGLARERINEAYAEKKLAEQRWLPDIYTGTSYYRHEGGIQSFQGPLINSSTGAMFAGTEINSQFDLRDYAFQKVNAQRQVWQQKGELSRVTSETLLDAANTYIDLLTALSGEAIARDLEKNLRTLLKRSEDLASVEKGALVEARSVASALLGQEQAMVKIRAQAAAATAKLVYLLAMDPCSQLVPVDPRVLPLELVDASGPLCDLVAQALANGPGIQEMEGILSLINDSVARSQGAAAYLPVFGTRVAEGGFGAGAGDSMTWNNRFDLGLQARWNLTEYLTRRNRKQAMQSKIHQAHLVYQELRNKLTLGVQEAQMAINFGRDQIQLGERQIDRAKQAYDLSEQRLKNNAPSASSTEVLLAVRSLSEAQLNYLLAVNAYDKAQVRLLVLLGSPSAKGGPACPQAR